MVLSSSFRGLVHDLVGSMAVSRQTWFPEKLGKELRVLNLDLQAAGDWVPNGCSLSIEDLKLAFPVTHSSNFIPIPAWPHLLIIPLSMAKHADT